MLKQGVQQRVCVRASLPHGRALLARRSRRLALTATASLSCVSCNHIITNSSDNLCLFHQGGQQHLTAKYEVPATEFDVRLIPEPKPRRAVFAPYHLQCPGCGTKLGTVCRFGPNHETVQTYKRDGVLLKHGGLMYCGLTDIVEERCRDFLAIRSMHNFQEGAEPGSALLFQPPAMYAGVSRAPVRRALAGGAGLAPGLDPMRLTATKPRPYQIELFVQACHSSSVVVLPTGAGKTLVAAMLVSAMRQLNPDKWVVFLNETCPLTEQQGEYLRQELLQQPGAPAAGNGATKGVQILHGDNSTPNQRAAAIGDVPGVLVSTPSAFMSLLDMGFDIHAISLLVLDEAHHTTKGHPFAEVAKRLKNAEAAAGASQPPLGLPQILGLTASPITSQSPLGMSQQLYALITALGARVVVPELYRLAGEHYARADTELLPVSYNEFDYATGVDCNNESLQWLSPEEMRSRLSRSARYISTLAALKEILLSRTLSRATDTLRVLIFAQRRAVAAALVQLLRADAVTADLRPDMLVGHSGEEGMSWRTEQKPVLDAFRQGSVQLLVATSVVEEGLDVPACDVVIRLDGVSSLRELIQSRGRVRHQAGRYLVLCAHHDVDALQQLHDREEDMMRVVASFVSMERALNPGPTPELIHSVVKAAVGPAEAAAAAGAGPKGKAQVQGVESPPEGRGFMQVVKGVLNFVVR